MNRVITIGGLHGTGKSSVADRVAREFGLRRVSAGMIFRQLAKEHGMTLERFSRLAEERPEIDRLLDKRIAEEARSGDVVLDGQLAAWMVGDLADLRVLLTAPLETRVHRIAGRDGVDYETALHETVIREESEAERYREFYNIDISDLSIYDLVINTEKYDLEGVTRVVLVAVRTLWGLD